MIDLRFITRQGKQVLQWRRIPWGTEKYFAFDPKQLQLPPKWTDWEDVRWEDISIKPEK